MLLPALNTALATVLLALAQDPEPPSEPPDTGQEPPRPEQGLRTDPWSAPPPRTPAQVWAEEESEALAMIERGLLNAWFRREPWAARELGYAEYDQFNGEFGRAETGRWKGLLDRYQGDLLSIHAGQLDAGRLADYRWLRAWVETQSLYVRILPQADSDPAWYVERVHRSIRSLAEADTPDAFVRVAHLARRLHGIPGILDGVRTSLVEPDRAFVEHGAECTVDLLLTLDSLTDLGAPLSRTMGQPAAYYGLRDRARNAAREFAVWLEAKPRIRETGVWAMAPRSWEGLLRAHIGTSLTMDELKVLLLRDLAGLDLAMGAHAPLSAPEEPLSAEDAAQLVRQGMAAATVVGISARFVPPDGRTPVVRVGPSELRGGPLAGLRSTSPEQLVLAVALDAPHWLPEMGATRRALLSPAGLMALGVRYGPAGEALLHSELRNRPGLTRRLLPNEATIGAFGLWATEWSTRLDWDENPIREDTALVAELARQRLLEAARAFAGLRLHGERRAFEEVATDLVRLARLDAQTARREVLEAMRNPLHGSAYISYLELRRVERDLRKELATTEAEALRLLGLALRRYPDARPADLLEVIGRDRARIDGETAKDELVNRSDR